MVFRNFWFKMLALLLAILTWFYVVGEVKKGNDTDSQGYYSSFAYKLGSRKIPVKPIFVNSPAKGYRIAEERTEIIPSEVMVIGPRQFLDKVENVTTKPIDVGENTKTFSVVTGLAPIGRLILPDDSSVTVKVFVEKVSQ